MSPLPEAVFSTLPARLRFSRCVADLQARAPELVPGLVQLQAEVGSRCPEHGELKDPIVGIVSGARWPEDDRIAFICPWCSAPEVREAWEREDPALVTSVPERAHLDRILEPPGPPETIWECAVCEKPMRVETGAVQRCKLCIRAEPHHFHVRCETCSPPGWYAAIRGRP